MKKMFLTGALSIALFAGASGIHTAHAGPNCDFARSICGTNDHNLFAWIAGAQQVCYRLANQLCTKERQAGVSSAQLQSQLNRIKDHRRKNYVRKDA